MKFKDEIGYHEHIAWGIHLRTCKCGGKRIKMLIEDPKSKHKGYRTAYYCPKCRKAIYSVSNKELRGLHPVSSEQLAKMENTYKAVARRVNG
jgi:hypothetical protein